MGRHDLKWIMMELIALAGQTIYNSIIHCSVNNINMYWCSMQNNVPKLNWFLNMLTSIPYKLVRHIENNFKSISIPYELVPHIENNFKSTSIGPLALKLKIHFSDIMRSLKHHKRLLNRPWQAVAEHRPH